MKNLAPITLTFFAFLSACAPEKPNDEMAFNIEAAVAKKLPNVQMNEYVRYYSHDEMGLVSGTFVKEKDANLKDQTHWVKPDDMPVWDDGGCSVVSLSYHSPTDSLLYAECNGP